MNYALLMNRFGKCKDKGEIDSLMIFLRVLRVGNNVWKIDARVNPIKDTIYSLYIVYANQLQVMTI